MRTTFNNEVGANTADVAHSNSLLLTQGMLKSLTLEEANLAAIGCTQDFAVEIQHLTCEDTLVNSSLIKPVEGDSLNIACPEDCSNPDLPLFGGTNNIYADTSSLCKAAQQSGSLKPTRIGSLAKINMIKGKES